jgi:hypothetical protein
VLGVVEPLALGGQLVDALARGGVRRGELGDLARAATGTRAPAARR